MSGLIFVAEVLRTCMFYFKTEPQKMPCVSCLQSMRKRVRNRIQDRSDTHGSGYGSDTLRRVQNESVDSPCTESIMPPTLSKFQDGEAKLDRTSTFGSASGSSPAKGKRRKGWEDEIREAVDVAIKISPKLNGVVSIMFPKQHVQLREVVKLIMVDDIFACNFLKTAKMWCNVDWEVLRHPQADPDVPPGRVR